MNETLKGQNTVGLSSSPFTGLLQNVKSTFFYAMLNQEQETQLINKIHNTTLQGLASIDFEEEIDNNWEITGRPEIQVIVPFLCKIFGQIIKDIVFTPEEILILSRLSKKQDRSLEVEGYKKYVSRKFAIQAYDLFNIIMLEENFGLEQSKGIMLVHNDILYHNHNYGDELRFTLGGKIKGAMLLGGVDPEILHNNIIESYRGKGSEKDDAKDLKQEKKEWLQGVSCIMRYKFMPALHNLASPSFGGDKESLFLLGDYYQMGEYSPRYNKRSISNQALSESEKDGLFFLEFIISDIIRYIENLDIVSILAGNAKLKTQLKISNIFSLFKQTIDLYVEKIPSEEYPDRIFNTQGEKFVKESLSSLISTGITDIFAALMLHNNLGIEEEECKRILLQNMRDGKKAKVIGTEILKAAGMKNKFGNDKIIEYIKLHVNSGGVEGGEAKCPYFQSIQKKEFIDIIWSILEMKFLPALQELFTNIKPTKQEELFLLGKYTR